MDEKTPIVVTDAEAQRTNHPTDPRCPHKGECTRIVLYYGPNLCYEQTRDLYIKSYCLTIFHIMSVLAAGFLLITTITADATSRIDSGRPNVSTKPTLEAHIMSKCPDARDCLRDLVVPTMSNVSEEVDFKLSYIGTNNRDGDGVECPHGEGECLGNIIELCAADIYPGPKIYLGFANCMTMRYSNIPQKDLVHDCALEHGLDFDELNRCASRDDGQYGMDLLRGSVARSADAGVEKSCTVRLNGKVRCIRDGGEWYDCEGGSKPKDLIHDIKALRHE